MGMLSYKLLLHDLEDRHPFHKLTEEQKRKNEYVLVNQEEAKKLLRKKIADLELLSPYDPDEKKVYDLVRLYGYDGAVLEGKLSFARVEHSDFINIFFKSENPELSAFTVNTIGEQFIRFFNSIYGIRSQESTVKLDSLTNSKKRIVDSLTEKLRDFRQKIGTPSVTDRATAAMGVVQELTSNYQQEQAHLNTLRGDLTAVETQLRDLNANNSNVAVPTVNNNAEILRLRRLNSDLELQKGGKSDDEVRKLQDQIDGNMRKIQQLSAGNTQGSVKNTEKTQTRIDDLVARKIELQQQILAAEQNVALFQKQRDQYVTLSATGGGDEVILNQKETELRIATSEYEQLKKSLQTSLDLDVNPQNDFKQTMVGLPAYQPEPAHRAMILGLAGILTLMLSSFIILGLEFMDSSYKTPSIFIRNTKLHLLSSLNRIDLRKRQLADYFHANGEVGKDYVNTFLENLRKLRYELENSGKKTFLVTSTKPGEGKTTVIESLANSLCLANKKVLMVDANFSHNTLTQKFEAKPTLEQFSLNGQPNGMDKFWSIRSMTSIPNTDLVGCAEGNYTPSEVLPKHNLLENLPRISENYDFIFIEGAALNNHADSKELARYVDGIIAVFSARSTLKQTDKDSIQYLKSTGPKFMGAVLNCVEVSNLGL
jgi:Mrp family chromosome partitioning ATPase/uncharacterized protein involved in exopolysaccharide biosynthesis